jgi:hypothetical protein
MKYIVVMHWFHINERVGFLIDYVQFLSGVKMGSGYITRFGIFCEKTHQPT